ncbi:hypothetical protein DYD21_03955 [Rhodohalobacter sp. SW132]|uniref:hypothetical protein n=1 Tax=Rhodohalobacter sp. SW132 TaxID=2293433 RepID=UPI000E265E08|nr:hypothetical protein [Rhodohalobacter sp. SW132]REL39119.1 hypothetical protein DYD21_03955 [Rhodohalobacter sp. SW132]
MNTFPIIEMLAFYSRYQRLEKPSWRSACTRQLHRVRSCHCKTDGGVRKSYYSIETKSGEIIDLEYNEEELVWNLVPSDSYPDHVVDKVLVLIKRHKHTPSRAHRVIPYRFEIFPESELHQTDNRPAPALAQRVEPFRFQSGKIPSSQIIKIVTRHLENVMVTKHLHYVVETDQHRFFHLVYILDEADWRLMNEVDEQFFFVK